MNRFSSFLCVFFFLSNDPVNFYIEIFGTFANKSFLNIFCNVIIMLNRFIKKKFKVKINETWNDYLCVRLMHILHGKNIDVYITMNNVIKDKIHSSELFNLNFLLNLVVFTLD